MNVVVEDVFH